MATQVAEQPKPVAAAAAFADEALSPVSKLEAARKVAALEQQKRIDAACARMAAAKKENMGKRKVLEARLEGHMKAKVQKTVVDPVDTTNTISRRLMDRFTTDPEPEQENLSPHQVTRSIATTQFVSRTTTVSTSATGESIKETQATVDEMVDETEEVESEQSSETVPATAFHAKQLGLTDEKLDIYAPPDVQQQELRKLRERAQFLPPQTIGTLETPSDAESDSDFADDDGSSDDSEDDSDAESLPDVDEEETRALHDETHEFEQGIVAQTALERRQALKWFFVWVPVYVITFCLLLLAVLFVIDWSQTRYEFCPVDAADVDDESPLSCATFVRSQATTKLFLRDAADRVWDAVEPYLS